MFRRFISRILPFVVLALALPALAAEAPARPNVLFILIDDLGWNDVGYNGSTFHDTPRIDALAKQSVSFEWAYAASPMCSPTRASIFTGKHPARHGITQYLNGWRSSRFRQITPLTGLKIPDNEVTIGRPFKEAGYATAFMGKWHMGPGRPADHGFDKTVAFIYSNSCAMYFPFRGVKGLDAKQGDYFNDKLTDKAIAYIDQQKEAGKPFFLYLSHFAMHAPIKSKPELRRKYQQRAEMLPPLTGKTNAIRDPLSHKPIDPRQDDPEYAGQLENLDQNIGRLIDHLEKAGLDDNTVVVFTADNGGRSAMEWHAHPTSVQPLRGGKTFVFEGGLRIPTLIRWPGVTKPGGVSKEPIISMDFYPTLLSMAGLPLKPDQHVDGVDLTPLLRGESIKRDSLFWHFPHYQGEGAYPASAVRKGRYKLIRQFHHERDLLFDLQKDPNETNDLIGDLPEVADELRRDLEQWFADTGAKLPVNNTGDNIIDEISEKHRDK